MGLISREQADALVARFMIDVPGSSSASIAKSDVIKIIQDYVYARPVAESEDYLQESLEGMADFNSEQFGKIETKLRAIDDRLELMAFKLKRVEDICLGGGANVAGR